MPTAVRQEQELRSIGLHEAKSSLHSKSRPAPSPATRNHHLFTPPPEYTLPPPPTYTYNHDTAFEHRGQNGASRKSSSSSIQSSDDGSRRGSKALGSIAGKNTLIDPKLSRQKLVDFASKITCLFWFESAFVLHRVSEASQISAHEPLSPYSRPTDTFKTWMSSMIATTQISQNVVFMALLFIYRLKMLNPTVKGKPGSECRLFTVAVMLGNKFLDDNTYTNKTWADVSRINVTDIHVMEVEFLSNMKYNLYTSPEQWAEWETKLHKFFKYWELASNVAERPQQPYHPRSTLSSIHTSYLPSPPLTEVLQSPSVHSPHSTYGSAPVSPLCSRPAPPSASCYQRSEQLPSRGYVDIFAPVGTTHSKKRSYDGGEDLREQQTKRVALGHMQQAPVRTQPTQQAYYQPYGYGENYSSGIIPPLQLEPPVPCTASYLVQLPQPQLFTQSSAMASIIPSNAPSYPSYPTSYARSNSFSYASTRASHNIQIASFGTNVSPVSYTAASSTRVSPLTSTEYQAQPAQRYGQTAARTQGESQATLQPMCHSTYPNAFGNVDRLSPYRPIRGVNTLTSNLPAPLSPTPNHYSEPIQFYPPTKSRSTNIRTGSAYCQEYSQFPVPGYSSYQPLEAN